MSCPYVFTPTFPPTWYLDYNPDPPGTPFIPPAPLPSSPVLPTLSRFRPSTPFETPYTVYGSSRRPRRPSWHAGMPPSTSFQTPDTQYHFRRRSFGGTYGTWNASGHHLPWTYPGTSLLSSSSASAFCQVHPLLNGEATYAGFYFDLASPTFSPLRTVGPGQFVAISSAELRQPATDPPIMRMRITHHIIPQWPIDIGPPPVKSVVGTIHPITLGDVLYTIHTSLGWKITHRDWDKLTISEQTEIACSYTRRYASVPSAIELEAVQGVRRVDYLGEKHVFRGLVRAHDEEGFVGWKLLT
ncbi:hypothetical protein V8B97DRAFT_1875834 [Scleroderma yunnanense]